MGRAAAIHFLFTLIYGQVLAQLNDWNNKDLIVVKENEGARKTNYQVLLIIDTQTLIAQSKMRSGGEDLRFSKDCRGDVLYPYFIENGLNTPATHIWVMIDTLYASTEKLIYMFYGNATAAAASDFDATFPRQKIISQAEVTADSVWDYDWIEIDTGAIVTITPNPYAEGVYGKLSINARKILINGTLEGSGLGFAGGPATMDGFGPGGGKKPAAVGGTAGGGGGHGGMGGYGGCGSGGLGGAAYDVAGQAVIAGSGGGSSLWIGTGTPGGNGGGAFLLNGTSIEVNGSINVNGLLGGSSTYSGGGGAGGGILIRGVEVSLLGTLSAAGGNAGTSTHCSGGGGGGGRIKVFCQEKLINTANIKLAGGNISTSATNAAAVGSPGNFLLDTITCPFPSATLYDHLELQSSLNPSCEGIPQTLSVTPAIYTSYDFYRNDTLVQSGNSPVHTSASFVSGNAVIAAGRQGTCTDTSNVLSLSIHPKPVLQLAPASASGCIDSVITLTATGASSISWSPATYLNTASGNQVLAQPSEDITYTVTGTSTEGCSTSTELPVKVSPVPPQPTITTDSVVVCEGVDVTLSATGDVLYDYVWTGPSGFSATGAEQLLSNIAPGNAGIYRCHAEQEGCAGNSSSVHLEVIPAVIPTAALSVSSGTNPLCTGDSLGLSVKVENEGTTPSYRWLLNGSEVLTGTPSYLFVPQKNDLVVFEMQSSVICATPALVRLGPYPVLVETYPAPQLFIAADSGSFPPCAGKTLEFNAVLTGAGNSTTYVWKVNGAPKGSNSDHFVSSTLTNGQVLTCEITTSNSCASQIRAVSNSLTVDIYPTVPTGVSIAAPDRICSADTVLFEALPQNGGMDPFFDWYLNEQKLEEHSRSLAISNLSNGDVVRCALHSSLACAEPEVALSLPFTAEVLVSPAVPVIAVNGYVMHSSRSLGNQWYRDGQPIAGANEDRYTVTQTGSYHVVVSDPNGCSRASDSRYFGFTGLTELGMSRFSISPNPASDHLKITGNSSYLLQLRDLAGRILLQRQSGGEVIMDISDLAPGCYWILCSDAQNVMQLPLIKQ